MKTDVSIQEKNYIENQIKLLISSKISLETGECNKDKNSFLCKNENNKNESSKTVLILTNVLTFTVFKNFFLIFKIFNI